MFEVPYEKLGRFSGNLATLLEAGIGIEKGLASSKRSLGSTRFGSAIEVAQSRVSQGAPLYEALAAEPAPWPRFYLPILAAGEQTGRTDETLRFLERHCKLLAGPAHAVRNAWLFPLVILLLGTALDLGVRLFALDLRGFLFTAVSSLRGYAVLGLVAIVLIAPLFRPLVDPLKLAVPWLGDAERELAMNRFFQVFAMMYATGGRRVDAMIRLSARCVSNVAVRNDLLRAAAEIELGQSLPQAFAATRYVTPSEKEVIASGDLSGTLEKAFERIAYETGEKLDMRMKVVTQVATRITMLMVIGSVIVMVTGLMY